MNNLRSLYNLGQSVWLDYIHREFILSGKLHSLIELGITGMTSNPSIFEKAIVHSNTYDQQIEHLSNQDISINELYTQLVLQDIRLAADSFQSIYTDTRGKDGYVSLEVNPFLANDTLTTIQEAKQLFQWVDRPNLMVKIPATLQGLPAITETIFHGINVNVTLIFSLTRYQQVIDAYLKGLEKRVSAQLPINEIHSVASFFVSRLDTKVDKILTKLLQTDPQNRLLCQALLGKAAVANAKLAYKIFQEQFNSDRFRELNIYGANYQRPLWASTSTKNPAYSDILYVQELIGARTVNTLPLETLEAFLDHGVVEKTIDSDVEKAEKVFKNLESLGISLEKVTTELEEEGVQAFARSFENLMSSLKEKRLLFKK